MNDVRRDMLFGASTPCIMSKYVGEEEAADVLTRFVKKLPVSPVWLHGLVFRRCCPSSAPTSGMPRFAAKRSTVGPCSSSTRTVEVPGQGHDCIPPTAYTAFSAVPFGSGSGESSQFLSSRRIECRLSHTSTVRQSVRTSFTSSCQISLTAP